jgi:surfeit locus 1 family protein
VTPVAPGKEAAEAAGGPRGWRSLVVLAAVSAIAFAILTGLGVWQLERRAWKETLIARVEAGLAADPVAAPGPDAWPSLDLDDVEYRPVEAKGAFDHGREIHVVQTLVEPNGPAGGIGYQVFTPFQTKAGWWVYVNRGFVPRDNEDPATRSAGQIEGETTVVGLLRMPGRRSWFMPSDDIPGNAWFSRDPALFAAVSELPADSIAPYIIDARFDPDLPGGLPQGGETIVSFPNNHLQYALTWFGLAAVLAGVFVAFAAKRIRE